MKTFKGTKGEWKVERCTNKLETLVATDEYRICDVKHYDDQIHETLKEPTFKEGRANAKLIAAAPDLLEALIEAKTIIDNNCPAFYKGNYSIIEKAIEKAIG